LAHISASIRLFESGEHRRIRHIVSHGFLKKGEIADTCVRHLTADGPRNTREVAERVMCERNLDPSDGALRNSVVFKVLPAQRRAARRNLMIMLEKRRGICVWGPAPRLTPRDANSVSRRG
jgi:hypothetical protein